MKVFVTDKFPEHGLEALRAVASAVTYSPDTSADGLADVITDHTVLVVRSTKVIAAVFEAAPKLQLVIRAGAGFNNVDVSAASARGVFVCNCPGKNAVAVAELTVGLLIALDRQIPAADRALREGLWQKKKFGSAPGLLGKTFGVIGVGQIGREVITRVAALGMHVVGWSRSLTSEKAAELGIERADSREALAARCDAMSVHLAHSNETAGCIGAEFFAACKPNSVLINVSRGGIVDEAALKVAIDEGGLRYGTDVFDNEPGGGEAAFSHFVANHPSCVATPHIGAGTDQAQAAVANETVRIVEAFVSTGAAPNCVNLRDADERVWQLAVRHLDRVGVLAAVLTAIREADINVAELENVLFQGGVAAVARIQLSNNPPAETLTKIASLEHVLGVEVT